MIRAPDASAFAIAQRNLDAIPVAERNGWYDVIRKSKAADLPMPERVIVELANTCNLDCPMCRVGAFGVDLRRVMPLERFKMLAAELFPTAKEVRLNGLGETTLVPDLEQYLQVIDNYPVSVELITNGTGSVTTYRKLIDMNATLMISWDAAEPALFERLRRPARWEELVATLTEVASYAEGLGRSDLLHLLFTLQPTNCSELPRLLELAAQWGIPHVVVNVAKLPSDRWMGEHLPEILASFAEAEEAAKRTGVRLYLPDHIGNEPIQLDSSCRTSSTGCDRPWKELVVRWDLEVQVCNMFNPYVYGHLDLHPAQRLWRGGFAQAFRAHLQGPNPHPYCRGCYYIGDVYARKQG